MSDAKQVQTDYQNAEDTANVKSSKLHQILPELSGRSEVFGFDDAKQVQGTKNNKSSEQILPQLSDKVVVLNVGGTRFETTQRTLCNVPNTVLCNMMGGGSMEASKPQADGSYFVDRNPRFFATILDYYRDGKVPCLLDQPIGMSSGAMWSFRQEAHYFGLTKVIEAIEDQFVRCAHCKMSGLDLIEEPGMHVECKSEHATIEHEIAAGATVTVAGIGNAHVCSVEDIRVTVCPENKTNEVTSFRSVPIAVCKIKKCAFCDNEGKCPCRPKHKFKYKLMSTANLIRASALATITL